MKETYIFMKYLVPIPISQLKVDSEKRHFLYILVIQKTSAQRQTEDLSPTNRSKWICQMMVGHSKVNSSKSRSESM